MGLGLYSCSSVDSPLSSSKCIATWVAFDDLRFGFGTGVMKSQGRRPAIGGCSSGCPSSSSAW